MGDFALLLRALEFAARRHRDQRRRDRHASPFVNHPIEVARLLADVGGVSDPHVLAAAALHDVVEDTETTLGDIELRFGRVVAALVGEVTDDPDLAGVERHRQQAERAPGLTHGARLIKIGDKIANLREMPVEWSPSRRVEYATSARALVHACRGTCLPLEQLFDAVAVAVSRDDGSSNPP
ncbi:MAG: HD domain-containing protein [Vicinamibacterales bacterium]